MPPPRLDVEHTAVLLVDVQEKLLPHIHDAGLVVQQIGLLLDAARALKLPVLVTEQYRKGLGPTVDALARRFDRCQVRHEKLRFSACIEPVVQELAHRGIRSVLVCGIEAHVCVLQTCLDLVASGYVTALVVDAIGSRRIQDRQAAVQRMVQAGVMPTTVESALLEMVTEAGTSRFKAVLGLIR